MIPKEMYINCVKAIANYTKEETKLYENTNGVLDLINIQSLQNVIVQFQLLLEYLTNDKEMDDIGTELSYFLYECQGGADPHTITIGGKDILMISPETLWEILQLKDKENSKNE